MEDPLKEFSVEEESSRASKMQLAGLVLFVVFCLVVIIISFFTTV